MILCAAFLGRPSQTRCQKSLQAAPSASFSTQVAVQTTMHYLSLTLKLVREVTRVRKCLYKGIKTAICHCLGRRDRHKKLTCRTFLVSFERGFPLIFVLRSGRIFSPKDSTFYETFMCSFVLKLEDQTRVKHTTSAIRKSAG